jgi:pyruvate dehydrogenase E1 component
MTEALQAFDRLVESGHTVYLYSITSYTELAREAALRGAGQDTYLSELLASSQGPIVAVTDWVRALPEQIRAFLPPQRTMRVLATDGFGRSDTRAALRDHFGVGADAIVQAFRSDH